MNFCSACPHPYTLQPLYLHFCPTPPLPFFFLKLFLLLHFTHLCFPSTSLLIRSFCGQGWRGMLPGRPGPSRPSASTFSSTFTILPSFSSPFFYNGMPIPTTNLPGFDLNSMCIPMCHFPTKHFGLVPYVCALRIAFYMLLYRYCVLFWFDVMLPNIICCCGLHPVSLAVLSGSFLSFTHRHFAVPLYNAQSLFSLLFSHI